MADIDRSPNPVDVYVGNRIRVRRRIMGLSRDAFAEAVSIEADRMEDFERGAERLTGAQLFRIAGALVTPVAYFFDGLPEPGRKAAPAREVDGEGMINAFLSSPEGLELARTFLLITDLRLRQQVLELVRAMTGQEASEQADQRPV